VHLDSAQSSIKTPAKFFAGETSVNRRERTLSNESIRMRAHTIYDEIIRAPKVFPIDHPGDERADKCPLDAIPVHSPQYVVTPIDCSSKETHVGMDIEDLSLGHGPALSPLVSKYDAQLLAAFNDPSSHRSMLLASS
jgi:hypothetical protein